MRLTQSQRSRDADPRASSIRVAESVGMTVEGILQLLLQGRFARLTAPKGALPTQHFLLCFSEVEKQYFVVVTNKPVQARTAPEDLKVFTAADYEQRNNTSIEFEQKRVAARVCMPDRAAFKEFEAALAAQYEKASVLLRRDVRAALIYFDADQQSRRLMLNRNRVPVEHLVKHGLASFHTHPGFWQDIARRVEDGRVNPSIEIDRLEVWVGDADPVIVTREQLMASRACAQDGAPTP